MTFPYPADEDRLVQAVVAKATRILSLIEAPLGVWGEFGEMGPAAVKPDWQIKELLFGFHYLELEVPTVDADTVIRQGLQSDPATFPPARLVDVERAIASAQSWVSHELEGLGVG